MPTGEGTTDHTDDVVQLWTGSWIAALAVGVLTWGLIIWCVVVYRRRKDDHQLPVQLRYHLPLELLYTFVPILMVGVLFFYTVQTQDEITEVDDDATDLSVQVYGRQWSWDFNYLDYDVYDTGEPADLDDISTGQQGLTSTPRRSRSRRSTCRSTRRSRSRSTRATSSTRSGSRPSSTRSIPCPA